MTASRLPLSRRLAECLNFVSALAILLAGAAHLSAATVIGSIQDVSARPYGGLVNTLQFTPLSCPQRIGTNTVWPAVRTIRLTNGVFSVNLVGGLYYCGLVEGPIMQTPKTVKILVPPNDTNVWQFNDCANLATNVGTFLWTNQPPSGVATNVDNALGTNVNLSGSFSGNLQGTSGGNVVTYGPYQKVTLPGKLEVDDDADFYGTTTLHDTLFGTGAQFSGNVMASTFYGAGTGLVNVPATALVGGAANLTNGNASTFFSSGTIPPQFLPSSINGTNGLNGTNGVNGQNGTNTTVGFSGVSTNLASCVLNGASYSNIVLLQQGSPLDGVYANPGTSAYGNASVTFVSTGTNWARGSFSYGQQYYLVGQGIFYGATNTWTNWCFFSYFKASAISLASTTVYSTNVNLTATPPATGWGAYSGLTPNPTYFPASAYVTTLTQHFNLTTYTNGVVVTNSYQ